MTIPTKTRPTQTTVRNKQRTHYAWGRPASMYLAVYEKARMG
jgi:hypothetical protein